MPGEDDTKQLEERVADWVKRAETDLPKVQTEIVIANHMLLWNINDNMSLIRDLMFKIWQQGEKK
jgi:hypothetical protein